MEINGKDISTFSARLMRGFTIGAATVETTYFQGRNRTSFNLIDQTYGMKPFEFGLQFEGDNRNKISTNKLAITTNVAAKIVVARIVGRS